MHPCLDVTEMVDLIFTGLKKYRPTLAALARTCRGFHEPALDVLWSEQDTLRHVLKCLPSSLWEEIPGKFGKTLLRITGTIEAKDWDRPLSFARRIQTLSLDFCDDNELFPNATVFEAISASFPQGYFCPNLRTLQWRPDPHALFPFIRLFHGDKLEAATVLVYALDASLPSDAIPRALKKLEFDCAGHYDFTCRTSSDIVMSLDRIEELCVPNLNRAAFKHLSRLGTLVSLELVYADIRFSGSLLNLTQSLSTLFPALRTLKLSNTSPEFILDLLSILPAHCQLESFHAGIQTFANHDLGAVYAALPTRLSPVALRKLHIVSDFRGRQSLAHPNEFAPLCLFQNLTHLRLEPPMALDVDDAMALDFARSWPNLISLVLNSGQPFKTTLGCLRGFAEHCQGLSHLGINFDASVVPSLLESRISQNSLTVLSVGQDSPVYDPQAVGRFLAVLFPGLRKISTSWLMWDLDSAEDEDDENDESGEESYSMRWREVEALLRMGSTT
ncbi:hypothetical protein FB45DRAFT_829810 [Roridomyces roridus]|uniref:F-box domain-containing protein n=1 Tax=Roridomyces roridus TaxID=1738132 RepID=A0AAD7BYN5_9AGAR|nr:hypothetical protein FB45DRAFT_829810 [Roridomyces roridus]